MLKTEFKDAHRETRRIFIEFYSLTGKKAVITGGNSGRGQAFSMALAKAGADIFIPSIVPETGETKAMIDAQEVRAEFMDADITGKEVCRKIVENQTAEAPISQLFGLDFRR